MKQCYETLIRVAQESGGKLPFRTNFILDEFANMPPLKDVTTMVTAARSRKIRFNFIIQNFAQLNDVYGKENAETIKGNCGNIIYLISAELAALEEISKLCGEVKSKKDDKTASTPLVTVSDLQRMPVGSMIVLRTRCMPFKTKMKMNWQMVKENLWGKNYDLAPYPQREKVPVQMFDIKKVVEEKRQRKIDEMLGGSSNNMNVPNMSIPPFPGITPKEKPFDPSSLFGGPSNNIDDLVKRIDAKIAELEEEERKEKEEKKNKETKDKKENKIEDKKFDENEITDDEFFDDFFNDDVD